MARHDLTFAGAIARVVDEEVTWLTDEQRDALLRGLLEQAYRQADPDEFLAYALTYHAPAMQDFGTQRLANL